MNPVMWMAFVLIAFLLTWDWLVKRRRVTRRAELSDEDFLNAYGLQRDAAKDTEILEVRRQIARELGLPSAKLTPDDKLAELRDHFSLVGNGDLALADLFEDLEAAAGKPVTARSRHMPETVREYIAAFLDRSRAQP